LAYHIQTRLNRCQKQRTKSHENLDGWDHVILLRFSYLVQCRIVVIATAVKNKEHTDTINYESKINHNHCTADFSYFSQSKERVPDYPVTLHGVNTHT
jgi:hypothetical protein